MIINTIHTKLQNFAGTVILRMLDNQFTTKGQQNSGFMNEESSCRILQIKHEFGVKGLRLPVWEFWLVVLNILGFLVLMQRLLRIWD